MYFLVICAILSSCARMPYQQWNQQLTNYESQLIQQKSSSGKVVSPDANLFNGVYNATKQKDAAPYPELGEIIGGIKTDNSKIQKGSDEKLMELEKFRTTLAKRSIKTVGPEWTDFQTVLGGLIEQTNHNTKTLQQVGKKDVLFDSICTRSKIRASPLLQYEVNLAEKMNALEDSFNLLSNTYSGLKREITKREDIKASMNSLNRMDHKIRQIESEIHQLSNLMIHSI